MAVDPSGAWLTMWRRQMARQGVEVLRSAGVHHPHPDPMALLDHSDPAELVGPYQSPTVGAFGRLCNGVIESFGLRDVVMAGQVLDLDPSRGSVVARLASGQSVVARRAVLATNTRAATWPEWAKQALTLPGSLPHRLHHVRNVDLGANVAPDADVVVVGGGLSAVQYALGAHRRGARVTLLARRPLEERAFDVDPGWLGPKYLVAFGQEQCWDRRAELAADARGGGTVPARWLHQIRSTAERSTRLEIVEGDEVLSVAVERCRWNLNLASQRILEASDIWLATGSSVTADRGLSRVLHARVPIHTAGGHPVLDHELRWCGMPIHVMGTAATLILGPAAGNLAGARAGAALVVSSVTGCSLDE